MGYKWRIQREALENLLRQKRKEGAGAADMSPVHGAIQDALPGSVAGSSDR